MSTLTKRLEPLDVLWIKNISHHMYRVVVLYAAGKSPYFTVRAIVLNLSSEEAGLYPNIGVLWQIQSPFKVGSNVSFLLQEKNGEFRCNVFRLYYESKMSLEEALTSPFDRVRRVALIEVKGTDDANKKN